MKAWEANLSILEIVAHGLESMSDKVCFVGGATTVLYLDGDDRDSARGTEDVDCVVQIDSRLEYNSLERKIEALGFEHDMTSGAPICRWRFRSVKVDIMPSSEGILGFSNQWYERGMKHPIEVRLPSGRVIKIFSLLYFLATKLEAFKDRGNFDYLGSRDLEDIVTVLDGRKSATKEISTNHDDLYEFLNEQFQFLLGEPLFVESLAGHLAHRENTMDRSRRILEILGSLKAPVSIS